MKKVIIFVIAFVMVLSSMGIAFASDEPAFEEINAGAVTPSWVGLNTITQDFQILSGGMANPIIRGTTYASQVDYVNVVVSLKKGSGTSWTTIKTWNQNITISLNKFTFNQTYAVLPGYSYKYSTTVKSYKNNVLVDSVSLNSSVFVY